MSTRHWVFDYSRGGRDDSRESCERAAYLDLTGQAIPPGGQVSGRTFLVENYDPLSAFANWRRGELGLRSWVSSLRTVDETAWSARDDLRPFGLMCLRIGWRMATRSFSNSTRHAARPVSGDRAASGTGQAPIARPTAPPPRREETPT